MPVFIRELVERGFWWALLAYLIIQISFSILCIFLSGLLRYRYNQFKTSKLLLKIQTVPGSCFIYYIWYIRGGILWFLLAIGNTIPTLITLYLFIMFIIQNILIGCYKYKAKKGKTTAQYFLGISYLEGNGFIEKSAYTGMQWLFKAAELGYAPAQTKLAICYYNGEGVKQELSQVFYWFSRAAEQGNAIGQYSLGICYEDGDGVTKDNEKAIYWYQQAAKQGHEKAQKALMRLQE